MKILVVGASNSKGGITTVINGMKNDEKFNTEYDITIFQSCIDGNIVMKIIYAGIRYIKFLIIYSKYDLFHLHVSGHGSTLRKMKYFNKLKKKNKKIILHIHDGGYIEYYKGTSSKSKKKIYRFLNEADKVILLSESWKKEFEKEFHLKNGVVVHNGIEVEAFSKGISNIQENKNYFVFIGRLGKGKGTYELINAVEIVVKSNPNIMIYLAGDGDLDTFQRIIREKGLDKNIEILGWINFEEKISLFSKVSTLILPTYYEGLPMSILEGMAAGKAVISTTADSIPEVIGEENGILITPVNEEELAEAIIRCSNNVNMLENMSHENLKRVERFFTVEKMNENIGKLYSIYAL